MKVLDFEVNEQTVKDVLFVDGDTYVIRMRGPASKYIDDCFSKYLEEVWLCVVYDMSEFTLYVTVSEEQEIYKQVDWCPTERLMEQIEKFVA